MTQPFNPNARRDEKKAREAIEADEVAQGNSIVKTTPELEAYVRANYRLPNTAIKQGWIPRSYLREAQEALASQRPVETAEDLYGAQNAAASERNAQLKSMTMAERKAARRAQDMEAAKNEYRAQRAADAAAGKAPVTKLDPLKPKPDPMASVSQNYVNRPKGTR